MIIYISSFAQFFMFASGHFHDFDTFSANGTTSLGQANITGTITKVIDGDSMDVLATVHNESKTDRIRLVLVDAPEYLQPGFAEAKNFVTEMCLDNAALVDPDDNQGKNYGRIVGVVYCGGSNVNAEILDRNYANIYWSFYSVSEFGNSDWAKRNGF
jgi:endonuclease YncB( thermonuclease family)